MKGFIFASFLLLGLAGFFLLTSTPVIVAFDPLEQACSTSGEGSNSSVCNQDGSNPVSGNDGILASVIRILSYIVGVVSVIMVIFGAFKYITSSGDANSISSAKNTILYALIGLVVSLFSQAIIIFVINKV